MAGDDDAAVDRLLACNRVSDLQQFQPVGAHGHRSFSFVLSLVLVIDRRRLSGSSFGRLTALGPSVSVLRPLPPCRTIPPLCRA